MNFTPAQIRQFLANRQEVKPRKKRGTGKVATMKASYRIEQTATCLLLELPIYTTTESNTGGHWRTKARRADKQREAIGMFLIGRELPKLPACIKFTRFGKKKLDGDNLQSAFKHVRDAVAERYKVDDASDLYTWEYDQEQRDFYGVRIEIQSVNK